MYKLTGHNILGQQYLKGLVDVVVLTKNKKNIVTSMSQHTFNINEYNVIVSNFAKTGKGFAYNCNLGAKPNVALGEFILFLNDDVVIKDVKQFMYDIIQPFFNQDCGMSGAEVSRTGFGINGSIMCIRRELFEALGGFDTNYFFMWEDNDLCQNVRRLGYNIAISYAKAEHEGNASMKTESDLWKKYFFEGRDKYNQKWDKQTRIIASMIVGNENERYLQLVINDLIDRDLVDKIVVVCDNSNKETIEELEALSNFHKDKIKIHIHKFKLFGSAENILRERAIQYALSENASIILPIDADEVLDDLITRPVIYELMDTHIAIDLKICHMWKDMNHMRTDGMFAGQKNVRIFKVLPEEDMSFYNKNIHCGSAPIYAYEKRFLTDYIFKHYGYVKKEDIKSKQDRQKKYDKDMLYESKDLYERIFNTSIATVEPFNKTLFLNKWK